MTGRSQVIVVGGGPAGLTAALALAHSAPALADRICVLERGRYPREKFCAGALGERGWSILHDLDAEPRIPWVSIDGLSLRTRSGEIERRPGRIGRIVRRLEFDAALADRARRRGIRIYEETVVKGVEEHPDGVRVETSRGALGGGVAVGADGVGSRVRRALGLGPGRLRAQVLEVDTEPVAGDRDRKLLHFDGSDPELAGYTWDFPTIVDGRPLICRGIYWLRLGGRKIDIRARLEARLERVGLALSDCEAKWFSERGFEPLCRVARGRLLLVGEAAGVDPVSGEGIPQAIEAGALLGRFLARALESNHPVEGWQRTFWRSRLARDLCARRAMICWLWGPRRRAIEGVLMRHPGVLDLVGLHFAGRPWGLRRSLRTLGAGALSYAGALLRPS